MKLLQSIIFIKTVIFWHDIFERANEKELCANLHHFQDRNLNSDNYLNVYVYISPPVVWKIKYYERKKHFKHTISNLYVSNYAWKQRTWSRLPVMVLDFCSYNVSTYKRSHEIK